MTEFRSAIPLPPIPADLTIPQFLLDDYVHPIGEMRKGPGDVWFIDNTTGRKFTFGKRKMMSSQPRRSSVKGKKIKVPNLPLSTANPMYTTNKLVDLLNLCRATMIVTDKRFLGTVGAAAKVVGIPATSIFLIDISENGGDVSNGHHTISSLVSEGEASTLDVPNLKLSGPSGGKTKAAFIFFSSGTTGKFKAAVLSHYAVIANIIQMAALQRDNGKPRGATQWALVSKDVVTGCLLDMLSGIPMRGRLTLYSLVPPHVVLICKDPSVQVRDYSHVKLTFTGGASLSVPLMESAKEIFPNVSISQGYGTVHDFHRKPKTLNFQPGMSELIIAAIQSPLQRINDGSCGPMLPGFVAKVLRSDSLYGGPGETGELVMTGPSVGMGYLGDEDATNSTFIDGWVHSGDEVRFSEGGELFIVDRLKELIKVRGFQVAPAEIEDHLMAHPFVGDACVVPFPDEYSGEVPLAFIVPSASAKKLL
ncbi:phenylacetyl-CoA ligase [Mycena alexandri]|uniref:Phenylacetyl-CoA ligase n=1 Tax=Mycena alexandri TaxID=1745969 RepID=A0AAD6TAH8_9AGAR|nr:phenylacetyl-CoA ligase [Mycena alexandri]